MLVLDGPEAIVYDIAFSADGEFLASCTKGSHIWIWGPGYTPYSEQVTGKQGVVTAQVVRFQPRTDRLYVGYDDYQFKWQDVRTGERGGGGYFFDTPCITSLDFLSETLLAVGTGSRLKPSSGAFQIWDTVTQMSRPPVYREPAGVRAVAAHPPSRTVAWATGNKKVTVWDTTRPDQVHFPQTHTSPSLAFHPDGHTLAAAMEWGVKLYDLEYRRERRTLQGHKGRVTAVAFSPDGRTLATGSWDETVRLWDAATGAEKTAFRWPTGKVYCLAYAPDGLRLAAAGDKGTVVVWDAE